MKRSAFIGTALAAAAAFPLPARSQALEERIREIVAQGPGRFGVFARTMAAGPALYEVNAYEQFPSASTIKLLIATTAFYCAQRKRGVMQERIRYDADRLIGGSDYMQNVSGDTRLSVAELIVPMIEVSDNTAANLLIGHFGTRLINRVGAEAGMLNTRLAREFVDYFVTVRHEENVTTPYDMAHLLYLIEYGAREGVTTILLPQSCRRMIHLMLAQTDRDKIPAGLPQGVTVANKTGEIDGTRDDVAIVEPFGDSPFILSIYSKDVDDYAGCRETFHRIAHLTYDSVAGSDD